MNRRDFLKSTGLLTGGMLLAKTNSNFASPEKDPKGEVIVLGAGLAGLAAAYTLAEKKRKVTVLETRNRIGGRVYTHTFEKENLTAELGGEWIGKKHKSILKLADKLKLKI
ncbi:MAG: FAD-dependent oxidoreductase, partial [Bacteroidia bacterium]|nr:FAD-dependent oxidoreductase [Bacteroidia bacterium]